MRPLAAFVASMWVWLSSVAGPLDPDALLFLGVLAVMLAVLRWCPDRLWRVRLAVFPVAMNVCFVAMGTAIPKLRAWRADEALRAVDQALLGRTPALSLERVVDPVLTESMSFCYALFFPMLAVAFLVYLFERRDTAHAFWSGIFTLYGIGFTGYVLVPAAGPYLHMQAAFTVPLDGYAFTRLNNAIVAAASNRVDAFPSLHCAVSVFILFFDRVRHPWRFRVCAAPCAGLWLATLYLRYHYFVDIACGFLLGALALGVARRRPGPD